MPIESASSDKIMNFNELKEYLKKTGMGLDFGKFKVGKNYSAIYKPSIHKENVNATQKQVV